MALVFDWWRRFGASRPLHGTAHDALMAMPGFFMALVLQLGAVGLRDWSGGVVFFTSGTPEPGASLLPYPSSLLVASTETRRFSASRRASPSHGGSCRARASS